MCRARIACVIDRCAFVYRGMSCESLTHYFTWAVVFISPTICTVPAQELIRSSSNDSS